MVADRRVDSILTRWSSRRLVVGRANGVRQSSSLVATPLESGHALIEEARALWRAEQADGDAPEHALGASWGCVALLKNPRRRIPTNCLRYWKQMVAKDPQPPAGFKCAEGEEPAVDRDAIFRLEWPQPTGDEGPLSSLDLLLGTATNPTLLRGCYPGAEEIAEAWNKSAPQWREYFWQNRKNGILTFEDEAIQQLLKVRSSAS